MMLDQFLESLSDRRKNQIGIPKCAKCEGPLTIDGFYYPIKDGTICADCYFEIMGDEVEKHPIAMPRKPRG